MEKYNENLNKEFYDEGNGLWYELKGDYYYPMISIPKQEKIIIGKYGRLRLQYLEEYHKAECMLMRINNELISRLLDIEDECRLRVESLVEQMAKKENVTEELKSTDMMLWVQKMNNIRNRATEIVNADIIYEV